MKLSLLNLENDPRGISNELLSEWSRYYQRKNCSSHKSLLLDAANSLFILARVQIDPGQKIFDAGFIQFEIEKTIGHIHLVFVRSERRGMKIGSELLKSCVDFMKTRRIQNIQTEILPQNLPSIRLFSGFGFKCTGGFRYEKKI